ncbi:unnamed protein product [Protopolystoma xenopodis]|uniref:USP domain-containing protein n=1 Tax=Protopolystoma xenopodis TaxID=117903 RepID=A0A448WNG7_9PLAT|nr:unnamed protein product [Protopolystoma xenopodis]
MCFFIIRYSRHEPFTTLNVDIRNHQNLTESLEQYVKGDLLEGDNAYFCEACEKKVNTLKRLCIKRLPLVLTIQLKRFDYDWEKSVPTKFNDYFEFPREIDMEPYTVEGVERLSTDARLIGLNHDSIPLESREQSDSISYSEVQTDSKPKDSSVQGDSGTPVPTRYTLRGVVVHSGSASGGHYYSFIRHFKRETGSYVWYKYDDMDALETLRINDA